MSQGERGPRRAGKRRRRAKIQIGDRADAGATPAAGEKQGRAHSPETEQPHAEWAATIYIECPNCGLRIGKNHFLEHKCDSDSIRTVSGDGGPGTGKRR